MCLTAVHMKPFPMKERVRRWGSTNSCPTADAKSVWLKQMRHVKPTRPSDSASELSVRISHLGTTHTDDSDTIRRDRHPCLLHCGIRTPSQPIQLANSVPKQHFGTHVCRVLCSIHFLELQFPVFQRFLQPESSQTNVFRRNAVATSSRVINDILTVAVVPKIHQLALDSPWSRARRDGCEQLTLPAWQCDTLLFLRTTVENSTTKSHDASTRRPPRSLVRSPMIARLTTSSYFWIFKSLPKTRFMFIVQDTGHRFWNPGHSYNFFLLLEMRWEDALTVWEVKEFRCPQSLLQRSSAGCLPWRSCSGAQGTARGGRGRRGQTRGKSGSRKGEVESRRVRNGWNEDDCECAQNLSQGMWSVRQSQLWNKCAVRADSVHVRHAIVDVNVVIGVVLCGLLVGVRVVPVLLVML